MTYMRLRTKITCDSEISHVLLSLTLVLKVQLFCGFSNHVENFIIACDGNSGITSAGN